MTATNLADVNIIDADGHVIDRDANLRKFIAEPYSRRQGSLLPTDRHLGPVPDQRFRRHPVAGKRLRRRLLPRLQ